jgi:hypothetical protein
MDNPLFFEEISILKLNQLFAIEFTYSFVHSHANLFLPPSVQ